MILVNTDYISGKELETLSLVKGMLAGVIVLIGGFTEQFWTVFVAIALIAVVPAIYSYVLYKKGI